MNNKYGLDDKYFSNKLSLIVRDAKHYTPDEMFNELSRLMLVAADQANLKVTVNINHNRPYIPY